MKRLLVMLLTLSLLSLTACGNQASSAENQSKAVSQVEQVDDSNEDSTDPSSVEDSANEPTDNSENVQESSTPADAPVASSDNVYSINLDGITTLDELEDRIDQDLTAGIETLNSQWKTLSTDIDSYEKYRDNSDSVAAFYETIDLTTEQLCIMLKEYTAAYARMIMDSGMTTEEMYDAADGINDEIYDDACDRINDEIYEDLLDEINDHFYEGILKDQPDGVDYSEWYDTCSNEYSQWYDTASDVYGMYYDTASDIYSFYYDIAGELYSEDIDRAEKTYARFLERIEKDKGSKSAEPIADAVFDTTLRSATNTDELEDVIEAHVSECVQSLRGEWDTLSADTDTYEKYKNNIDAVEDFHTHVEDSAAQILAMICDYGVSYADLVLQSGSSTEEMYDSFEDFKDCIYDDALDIVKDEIYEGLLEDIKDYYYDGVLKDSKDGADYSEWSDMHSDSYSWWSDARSKVYSGWSDARSDVYSFYSDMRGKLYSGDLDGANEELEDFKKKVERMK